jgi:hypothetical protein
MQCWLSIVTFKKLIFSSNISITKDNNLKVRHTQGVHNKL